MCHDRKKNFLRPAYLGSKENRNRKKEGRGGEGKGRTAARGRETGGRDAAAEKYNLLDRERTRAT